MADSRRPRFKARSRGASSVEYAILLFLVIVIAAIVYKVIGNKVGHSASETVQRFDGKGGDGDKAGAGGGQGDKGGGKAGAAGSAGGAGSAGAGGGAGGNGDQAGGGAGGAGGDQAGGGGGGGGKGGGGNGNASVETNDRPQGEESHAFPFMKILAAVFVVLFAAAAFFAFRKGKGSA